MSECYVTCNTILDYIISRDVVLHSVVLRHTLPHYVMLYCVILYDMYRAILYCVVACLAIFYCIAVSIENILYYTLRHIIYRILIFVLNTRWYTF